MSGWYSCNDDDVERLVAIYSSLQYVYFDLCSRMCSVFFYCVLFLSLFDSLKNATFYLFLVSSVYIPFSYTLLLLLCVSMLFLLMFFKHKNLCLLNTLTHFMNTLPLLYSSQPAHRLDNWILSESIWFSKIKSAKLSNGTFFCVYGMKHVSVLTHCCVSLRVFIFFLGIYFFFNFWAL